MLLSDCPGCASPQYERLPYMRSNRPLWTLDDIEAWRDVSRAGPVVAASG